MAPSLPNKSNEMPANTPTEFTENDHQQNKKNSNALQQWKIISALIREKREPIELEKRLLDEGSHPKYLEEISRCREQYELEMQRINTVEKSETARIEETCSTYCCALEKEYENRINELVETLWQELEDKNKHLDGEMSTMELNRWDGTNWTHSNNNSYSQTGQGAPGKKLRRRPYEPNVSSASNSTTAGPSNGVEQNSGGGPAEKKVRKRSPGANYPLITQTLLSAQSINSDIERFYSNDSIRHPSSSRGLANHSSISSSGPQALRHNFIDHAEGGEKDTRKLRRVLLEEGKMICDGKTFHRTQNVSIQSDNTGWKMLPARIIQINDLTVQFRSAIQGDTRIFNCSKEDLEKSVVLVYKRY